MVHSELGETPQMRRFPNSWMLYENEKSNVGSLQLNPHLIVVVSKQIWFRIAVRCLDGHGFGDQTKKKMMSRWY